MILFLGAGRHSESKKPDYSKLCKAACKKAAALIAEGKPALDAATEAVCILEDSALTNAGFGSNLTWDGTVECDACAMDGSTSLWGAVGAVSGLKNPCQAAREICLGQRKEGTLGRVPPCILVGPGAFDWAKSNGIRTVDSVTLIHGKALKKYQKCKRMVLKEEKIDKMDCELRSDTVGAVCVDKFGKTAAVCSSGGIILKHCGRLGQAAMFGAGCWSEGNDFHQVATCTTGCGEQLIRCNLARLVGSRLADSKSPQPHAARISSVMTSDFLNSPYLKDADEKMGGVLALTWSEDHGELLWSHTTQTMAVGYMQVDKKPVFKISSLPSGKVPGKSIVVEGINFNTPAS